jgi:phosphoglycerate dehydrogenase-like enzyme
MRFKMVFLPPQNDVRRDWAERLARDLSDVDVVVAEDEADALREIPDAPAAFGGISSEVLAQAGALRWLQAPQAAPPAGFYYPELISHPVEITNFREIYNDHIATHILAFVLCFARGFQRYIPQMVHGEWRKPDKEEAGVVHLPEATALIVGVGGIGSETARLCAEFGMRVLGVDARRESAPPGVAELHRPEALESLLPQADFVILTIPHTPQTKGLMDAGRFGLMKRSAYFINIGRGMTTRLDALNDALRAGQIAGAGLDVYEIEPLPPGHPLWTAPNVLLTPHVAGQGPYLDERRYEIILDNARRFSVGQPLRNLVDKANWF